MSLIDTLKSIIVKTIKGDYQRKQIWFGYVHLMMGIINSPKCWGKSILFEANFLVQDIF